MQKLNIILITSPELADFRKRLKSLETRVSQLMVYIAGTRFVDVFFFCSKMGRLCLLRCIGRGAIMLSLFSPCVYLLRRTNMPRIYSRSCELFFRITFELSEPLVLFLSADLEITVPMLVQVDKLVQLIESPVFTCMFSLLLPRCHSNVLQISVYNYWSPKDTHTSSNVFTES